MQVCTYKVHGELNLDTTSDYGPTLAGELCGFFSSLALCFIMSWAFPQPPYDWQGTRSIEVLDNADAKVPSSLASVTCRLSCTAVLTATYHCGQCVSWGQRC